MSGKRYFDFDAFWAAQERKPITIKVFGEVHLLPPALPAKVILKAQRYQELGQEADVPIEEIRNLANDLFGKDRVAKWLEEPDFDIERLGGLFAQTMLLYQNAASEEGDEGEAPAPTTGLPSGSSSSTGDSSKPTSSASTGST